MQVHMSKKVSLVMCNTELRNEKKKIKEINFSDVPGFNNLTAYKQSKLIRTYNIKKLEMKFNFFMLVFTIGKYL